MPQIFVLNGSYAEDVNVNKNVNVSLAGGSVDGKISGTTGTLTATGTESLGDESAAGVDTSSNLNVGSQTVTLLDSVSATLNGTTTLNAGVLDSANGVTIGGTLTGDGTVNSNVAVVSGGHVAPGFGPGQITVNGNWTLNSGANYDVDLDGLTPVTGYDQVVVTSAATTINLGNATLNLSRLTSFTPLQGTTFTIIVNQSSQPITGTFNGYSDNSVINASGISFRINYNVGSSDDVVLTVVAPNVVYVNNNFANPVNGQDPDGAGPAQLFGYDSFATIQEGLNQVASGGIVYVYQGNAPYDGGNEITKPVSVLSIGPGSPTVGGDMFTSGSSGAFEDAANAVTIEGITMNGALSSLHQAGVILDGGFAGETIQDNAISGYFYGVLVANVGTDAESNVQVNNNSLTGNEVAGIRVDAGCLLDTMNANFNDFSGNTTIGLQNNSTSLIDASGSWWGSNTLAGVQAQVNGPADYTPFLNVGTDTSAATGFQPDFSSLTVTAAGVQNGVIGRIQEAVNLLADGSLTGANRLINVLTGSYTDNVVIAKSLSLIGAGSGTTTINAGGGVGIAKLPVRGQYDHVAGDCRHRRLQRSH